MLFDATGFALALGPTTEPVTRPTRMHFGIGLPDRDALLALRERLAADRVELVEECDGTRLRQRQVPRSRWLHRRGVVGDGALSTVMARPDAGLAAPPRCRASAPAGCSAQHRRAEVPRDRVHDHEVRRPAPTHHRAAADGRRDESPRARTPLAPRRSTPASRAEHCAAAARGMRSRARAASPTNCARGCPVRPRGAPGGLTAATPPGGRARDAERARALAATATLPFSAASPTPPAWRAR
jgi:hypothetical protein